jgi:hypothetical protein
MLPIITLIELVNNQMSAAIPAVRNVFLRFFLSNIATTNNTSASSSAIPDINSMINLSILFSFFKVFQIAVNIFCHITYPKIK